jgi:hypothetical protein
MIPLLITAAQPPEEARLQKPWADLGIYVASGGRLRNRETQAMRQEFAQAETRLAHERVLAKQVGILVDWREMQRPLPPAEQNAAIDYVELTRILAQRPLGKKTAEIIARAGQPTQEPSDLAVIEKTVAERKDVLDLVRRATDKPACVFQRDWSLGPDVTFPEYVQMRQAMRLLKADSLRLARSGHEIEAVREASRGFRLAAHAASERTLISQLVGMAIETITLSSMDEILEQCGPNMDIANRVRQAITERPAHYDLRAALCTETLMPAVICTRLGQAQTFERLAYMTQSYDEDESGGPARSQNPPPGRKPFPGEAQMIRQLFDAQCARHLAQIRHLVKLAEEPPLQRLSKLKQEAHRTPSNDPIGQLMPAFDADFSKFAVSMLRTQAKEQVLLAATGLLTYRASHPAFPPLLQKAFARPPYDPFTGAPLRYRVEANGFVVYSVGEHGTFDGGKPGMKRLSKEAYFRYTTGNGR